MPEPLPDALLADLRAAAGDAAVSSTPVDLFAYSRDLWPRLTVGVRDFVEAKPPLAVVRPVDEAAVLRVVQALARHGVPVVPFGAGSGVCGGAAPLFGGVVVDLKRLDRLEPVDAFSLQVSCGPGLILQTLEERLNDSGYTLGHFPSSIYCASIGGCVAARGAGQLSSRYGKIEDMVTGLRVVTPDLGVISTGSLDPSARPPDWSPVFVGSEGTLGLITSIRLRVHPLADALALRGFRFPSVSTGIAAFREILQSGLRPSVMRLYDPLDTWMAMQKGNDEAGDLATPVPGGGLPLEATAPGSRAPLGAPLDGSPSAEPTPRILGSVVSPGTVADSVLRRLRRRRRHHRSVESDGLFAGVKERLIGERLRDLMKPENLPVERLLASPGLLNRTVGMLPGRSLGILGCEGSGPVAREQLEAAAAVARRLGAVDLGVGPGERWYRTRYHVSFKLPKLLGNGGFADTMETAAPWTRVEALYDAVRSAVSPHVLVMAHLSHAYHEGCSIYFTFVGYGATPEKTQAIYQRTWDAALSAALEVGATITHHHGVGVLKRDFMDQEHGDGRRFYDALRRAVDSGGSLNPGKLFPPTVPEPGPAVEAQPPQYLAIHEHIDGVVEAGLDWQGVDLVAALSERGHFLPPLGRNFLESRLGDWLEGPAVPAHVAVHGAWEHPVLAVEGRFTDGRAWRSGRLPRSAAGPSWLPFGVGSSALPVRATTVTLRTLTPPQVRSVGFRFSTLDQAALALRSALRGGLPPLAGVVIPGSEHDVYRTLLEASADEAEGAVVYLALLDPEGFPLGTQQVIDVLAAQGGEPLSDDASLAWWEDHWAQPSRQGREGLEGTGFTPTGREIGRCEAVAPWRKAIHLLRSVETLTGGSARAVGWLEAPRETGCTVHWRFLSTRSTEEESSLVSHQVLATLHSCGARLAHVDFPGVAELPDYTVGGRGSLAESQGEDLPGDSERLARALAEALEAIS